MTKKGRKILSRPVTFVPGCVYYYQIDTGTGNEDSLYREASVGRQTLEMRR